MAEAAQAVRSQMEAAMRVACAEGIIIALPALPGPPPHRDASPQELARFEDGALQLASIAALSGVPQACVSLATGVLACRQPLVHQGSNDSGVIHKAVCAFLGCVKSATHNGRAGLQELQSWLREFNAYAVWHEALQVTPFKARLLTGARFLVRR